MRRRNVAQRSGFRSTAASDGPVSAWCSGTDRRRRQDSYMEETAGHRVALRWVLVAVAAVVVVVAVVAAVLLTRGSTPQSASSGATPSPHARPLQVHTKVTRVAGHLPASRRRSVKEHVGALVKGY